MPDYIKNRNKIFWSPSVKWRKTGEKVKIEIFSYSKPFSNLFPEFYFVTQNGIYETELLSNFDSFNKEKLKIFVNDLKSKRILIDSILSPSEIFYPQSMLLEHNYGESLILDSQALEKFRMKQLNRSYYSENTSSISLSSIQEVPDFITQRKTVRKFNTERKISFSDFCYLAAVYRQIYVNEEVRYLYASAGGLYPIDIYYYFKSDRVEDIESGLYYYDPVKNILVVVDKECVISKEVHYYTNQNVFLESAFSIFYFYNGEVSIPKYGGLGYYYALIDLGIMIGTYTALAQSKNIGLCSIGEMNFGIIENYFKLKKNQIYLHTIEVGSK